MRGATQLKSAVAHAMAAVALICRWLYASSQAFSCLAEDLWSTVSTRAVLDNYSVLILVHRVVDY
jgi:hypothetical protein